jgi:predicted dehydrogenase
VALYALEHGKHVAIEVPSALTLDDCWALVNTAERTRRHCMMLENCCYDFFELSTLALAQAGVFGEIIHVEGAYHHYLSEYWDEYWNNWRLDYNSKHRGDLYPTHGFGPVCQVLGIHRGDRLQTLVAMDTESFNGRKLVEDRRGDGSLFADGDLSATMIRTAKGKSILIEHDVMTPRPYNRMYQVVGTKGYAGKYPVQQVVVESESPHTPLSAEKLAEFQEKYPSPILNPEFIALAQSVGGHGGMDFIMDYRLIYCLNNGLPLDMDVYDLAEWCSLIELSRISMDNGCAPVEVPDFTRGAWDRVKGFTYAFAK